MKQIVYTLICLTWWAQFDDVLLPCAPALQSTPLTAADDEYVPAKRQVREQRSASHRPWLFSGLKSQTADFASRRNDLPPPSKLAAPGSPSLYVFMSLQI